MVTARSCIASRSAAWVRGVVRFTSSASRTSVKTGPGWKANSCVRWLKTLVPNRSTGIRSGVNWMRRKRQPRRRERASARSVLPVPGGPSMRPCPPASRQARVRSFISGWPRMTRSSCSRMREKARCRSARGNSASAAAVLIAKPFESADEDGEMGAELGVGDPPRLGREIETGGVLGKERLGPALAQALAQSDLVHEALAVEVERLGGRERAPVERGHRVDQLDGIGAGIAIRICGRTQRDRAAPEGGAENEGTCEQRRAQAPAAQQVEHARLVAQAVDELVEHHWPARAGKREQELEVVGLAQAPVEEKLRLGEEPYLAFAQRPPRQGGSAAALEDGLRVDERLRGQSAGLERAELAHAGEQGKDLVRGSCRGLAGDRQNQPAPRAHERVLRIGQARRGGISRRVLVLVFLFLRSGATIASDERATIRGAQRAAIGDDERATVGV